MTRGIPTKNSVGVAYATATPPSFYFCPKQKPLLRAVFVWENL